MAKYASILLFLLTTGCATSMMRIPIAEEQYPLTLAVESKNVSFAKTFAGVVNKSGLVEYAGTVGVEGEKHMVADLNVEIRDIKINRSWRRNTWCYVTTIPGFPFAFLTTSIVLAPILGPYGGYLWFPPNVVPIVTVEVEVTATIGLGPDARTKITEKASMMSNLRRSWVQCGQIDDKWFSSVLGSWWDRNYETESCKWKAFWDPKKYDWSSVEKIACHNIACRAVPWLESVLAKMEE